MLSTACPAGLIWEMWGKTPWNNGLQQFRDAVMEHAGPGNGGNRYLLHLDFGDKEPWSAVAGRNL